MLSDPETQDLLHSRQTYDMLIIDGAYPECAMGLAHHFGAPYIYINTVGFYIGSLSLAGNPAPYSFTPFLGNELLLVLHTHNTNNFTNRFLAGYSKITY